MRKLLIIGALLLILSLNVVAESNPVAAELSPLEIDRTHSDAYKAEKDISEGPKLHSVTFGEITYVVIDESWTEVHIPMQFTSDTRYDGYNDVQHTLGVEIYINGDNTGVYGSAYMSDDSVEEDVTPVEGSDNGSYSGTVTHSGEIVHIVDTFRAFDYQYDVGFSLYSWQGYRLYFGGIKQISANYPGRQLPLRDDYIIDSSTLTDPEIDYRENIQNGLQSIVDSYYLSEDQDQLDFAAAIEGSVGKGLTIDEANKLYEAYYGKNIDFNTLGYLVALKDYNKINGAPDLADSSDVERAALAALGTFLGLLSMLGVQSMVTSDEDILKAWSKSTDAGTQAGDIRNADFKTEVKVETATKSGSELIERAEAIDSTHTEVLPKDLGPAKDEDLLDEKKGKLSLVVDHKALVLEAGDTSKEISLFVSYESDVLYEGVEEDIELALRQTVISIDEGVIGSDYLRHETIVETGYRQIICGFNYSMGSEFYKADSGLHFPLGVPIRIDSLATGETIEKMIDVSAAASELFVSEKVLLLNESTNNASVLKAQVRTLKEEKFTVSVEISDELTNVIDHVTLDDGRLTLETSAIEGKVSSIEGHLLIKAVSSTEVMEKKVTVKVVNGGLVYKGENPFEIIADGRTNVKLPITAYKSRNGQITTDFDALESIVFSESFGVEDGKIKKAYETAGIEFINGRWEKIGDDDYYTYDVRTKRFVPSVGDKFTATIDITGRDGSILKLPLVLTLGEMGPGSENWHKEYDNLMVMLKHIPESHREKIHGMIDAKAEFLGAEGLYLLRKKIWKIGQTLWEAEGLSGYEDVERWAGYIEDTLNWVEWLSKYGVQLIATASSGGNQFVGIAASEIQDMLKNMLIAYSEGADLGEWYDQYFLGDLADLAEQLTEQALDPDEMVKLLEKVFKKDVKMKILAYLMLFAFKVVMHIKRRNKSFPRAIVDSACEMSLDAVMKFTVQSISKKAPKMKVKWTSKANGINPIKKIDLGSEMIKKSVKKATGISEKLPEVREEPKDKEPFKGGQN